MGYGVKSIIGVRFQETYPRIPLEADAYEFFEFMSETITEKIPPLKVTGMRGIYDEGETEAGARTVDGDINIEARAADCAIMLKAMFGAPTTTQVGGTAEYSHVLTPCQTDFSDLSAKIPLSIHKELDIGAAATVFADMNASMIEFTLANGDFLKTKLSLVGGQRYPLMTDTAAYKAGRRFTWDQTTISLGGASNCDFRELTIAVDDSLEAQHTICGTAYPSRIKRTDFRKMTVGATLVFRDLAEVAAFHAQSERVMTITNVSRTEIAATGNFETLIISLPAMRYTDMEPAAGAPGSLELSVNADAKYSGTTGMTITLNNDVVSYA